MTRNTHAFPIGVLASALIAVVGVALAAAPADAQRRPTRDAPPSRSSPQKAETPTRTTPLQYATSLRRAGRSAGQAAVAVTRRYRQKSNAVAATLLRAGYEAGPVGRALVENLRESPERAAADLEAGGVRDARELYGALLQMTRSRPDALKIVKAQKGSRVAIDVFGSETRGDPPSAAEAAAEMDEAGFTLIEIADWLMRGSHELSAEEVLALFLELNLAQGDEASFYEWLRGQGLSARDAAAAAAGAGVDDVASLLAAAGYAWDEIVDALEWAGETALDATRAAVDAGAPLADMVRWLIETEKATLEEIFDAYQDQMRLVLEIMLEMHDTQTKVLEASTAAHDAGMSLEDIVDVLLDLGLSAEEIAETLHQAGHDAEAIAGALIANGIEALAVALALDGIGEKIKDIARVLSDHVSPQEIAAILAEMQVSLAKQLEIMTTVMGLSHDAAMAIIGNLQ